MKLVVDESVDAPVIRGLRTAGYVVDAIAEICPGVSDDVVLDRAVAEDAILVTVDKDFGELVFRLKRVHSGVVLLRLSGSEVSTGVAVGTDAFDRYGQQFECAFSVVGLETVRIRHRWD